MHFGTHRRVHTATETSQKCEMFFTKSSHIFKCSVKRDNARFTIGKAKMSVEYCKIVSKIKFHDIEVFDIRPKYFYSGINT